VGGTGKSLSLCPLSGLSEHQRYIRSGWNVKLMTRQGQSGEGHIRYASAGRGGVVSTCLQLQGERKRGLSPTRLPFTLFFSADELTHAHTRPHTHTLTLPQIWEICFYWLGVVFHGLRERERGGCVCVGEVSGNKYTYFWRVQLDNYVSPPCGHNHH